MTFGLTLCLCCLLLVWKHIPAQTFFSAQRTVSGDLTKHQSGRCLDLSVEATCWESLAVPWTHAWPVPRSWPLLPPSWALFSRAFLSEGNPAAWAAFKSCSEAKPGTLGRGTLLVRCCRGRGVLHIPSLMRGVSPG